MGHSCDRCSLSNWIAKRKHKILKSYSDGEISMLDAVRLLYDLGFQNPWTIVESS
jgi:hypothetical protein